VQHPLIRSHKSLEPEGGREGGREGGGVKQEENLEEEREGIETHGTGRQMRVRRCKHMSMQRAGGRERARARGREGGREGGRDVPVSVLQGQDLQMASLHPLKNDRLGGLIPGGVKLAVDHHFTDDAVRRATGMEGGREGRNERP